MDEGNYFIQFTSWLYLSRGCNSSRSFSLSCCFRPEQTVARVAVNYVNHKRQIRDGVRFLLEGSAEAPELCVAADVIAD